VSTSKVKGLFILNISEIKLSLTNLVLSVDVNSLSQELFHSLDITTATNFEKLRSPPVLRLQHGIGGSQNKTEKRNQT
jgi:hypothetical protein